jgi:hypothetical protein
MEKFVEQISDCREPGIAVRFSRALEKGQTKINIERRYNESNETGRNIQEDRMRRKCDNFFMG